jgi:hypothetical protein
MVEFISNPKFFIVFCIIENGIIDILLLQFIDNLNLIEVDHGSVRSTAGNVGDNICLDTNTHFDKLLHERNTEMNSRFG